VRRFYNESHSADYKNVPSAKKTTITATLLSAEIDTLGALEKELAPFRVKFERAKILRETIRAHYDASPAAEPFTAAGAKFSILVGPRANERTINEPKLIRVIGLKLYATLAHITLKALDGCPGAAAAGCVSSALTGSRPLKTFERTK
jgi:hypothetical protein